MKKLFILTIVFLSLNIDATAQKKSSKNSVTETAFVNAYNKYKLALKYLDYNSAISATQDILISNPEKINFKDTLLTLYASSGKNTSAVLLAKEMEENGSSSKNVLEVLAATYQSAGYLKESLIYYEKLVKTQNELYYIYQIATIQFNLSRLQECSQTLNAIIKDPNSKTKTIQIDYEDKSIQNVPYQAAAYNILGVLSLQLKEENVAKTYFTNALSIYPEFLLAKNNLDYLLAK